MRANPRPRTQARPGGAARPYLRALLMAVVVQACATENVTQVEVVSVTVQPGNVAIETGGTVEFEALVADETGGTQVGAPVSWSSDTPDVVFVDQSGIAHALTPGSATVEAEYRGVTGSASVLVVPGPSLVVEPNAVSIAGNVLGHGPTTETVRISNGGLGRLTGLTASVTYESGGMAGWLRTSLSTDATPATLTLTPDVAGVPAGVYDAVVVVTAGGSGGLSTSMPVRLTLTGITVRETGNGGGANQPGGPASEPGG